MKNILALSLIFVVSFKSMAQPADSVMLKSIYSEALLNGQAYAHLKQLCKNIGPRLSGSENANKAVEWVKNTMKETGAAVFTQDIMVPYWVRGKKEYAEIVSSKNKKTVSVKICALGGSVNTGDKPLAARVIEVNGMEELKKLKEADVKGKFVFLNKPMNATKINTFDAYGEAVGQRWAGAKEAAPLGAVGVIVRSVNPSLDDHPHTGSMGYAENGKKIPACAISTNDADMLSQMLRYDPELLFNLSLFCETKPDTASQNVIAELKGSLFPDEYIIVGGHLDSWDLAEGAHDDGAGVVQAIEVIRIFKQLGIKPKRTIRAVSYMNEENGGRGGKKYAEVAKEKNEIHIAAIESDAGGFSPRGFFTEGDSLKGEKIKSWKPLFEPYEIHSFNKKGGGADIGHLKNQNTFLIGLLPDTQRYFDIHHSELDVFEAVNRRELLLGAATMASLVYLIDQYGL